jgi:hypothetical protein
MSPKLLSSTILHWERVNKVFGTRAEGHRLQRELRQADRRRQGTASHIWFLLSNHVLHIEYADKRRHDFVR